jgi:hypothetical protein
LSGPMAQAEEAALEFGKAMDSSASLPVEGSFL